MSTNPLSRDPYTGQSTPEVNPTFTTQADVLNTVRREFRGAPKVTTDSPLIPLSYKGFEFSVRPDQYEAIYDADTSYVGNRALYEQGTIASATDVAGDTMAAPGASLANYSNLASRDHKRRGSQYLFESFIDDEAFSMAIAEAWHSQTNYTKEVDRRSGWFGLLGASNSVGAGQDQVIGQVLESGNEEGWFGISDRIKVWETTEDNSVLGLIMKSMFRPDDFGPQMVPGDIDGRLGRQIAVRADPKKRERFLKIASKFIKLEDNQIKQAMEDDEYYSSLVLRLEREETSYVTRRNEVATELIDRYAAEMYEDGLDPNSDYAKEAAFRRLVAESKDAAFTFFNSDSQDEKKEALQIMALLANVVGPDADEVLIHGQQLDWDMTYSANRAKARSKEDVVARVTKAFEKMPEDWQSRLTALGYSPQAVVDSGMSKMFNNEYHYMDQMRRLLLASNGKQAQQQAVEEGIYFGLTSFDRSLMNMLSVDLYNDKNALLMAAATTAGGVGLGAIRGAGAVVGLASRQLASMATRGVLGSTITGAGRGFIAGSVEGAAAGFAEGLVTGTQERIKRDLEGGFVMGEDGYRRVNFDVQIEDGYQQMMLGGAFGGGLGGVIGGAGGGFSALAGKFRASGRTADHVVDPMKSGIIPDAGIDDVALRNRAMRDADAGVHSRIGVFGNLTDRQILAINADHTHGASVMAEAIQEMTGGRIGPFVEELLTDDYALRNGISVAELTDGVLELQKTLGDGDVLDDESIGLFFRAYLADRDLEMAQIVDKEVVVPGLDKIDPIDDPVQAIQAQRAVAAENARKNLDGFLAAAKRREADGWLSTGKEELSQGDFMLFLDIQKRLNRGEAVEASEVSYFSENILTLATRKEIDDAISDLERSGKSNEKAIARLRAQVDKAQEATDLARKVDPERFDKAFTLDYALNRLRNNKAVNFLQEKGVDLRSAANWIRAYKTNISSPSAIRQLTVDKPKVAEVLDELYRGLKKTDDGVDVSAARKMMYADDVGRAYSMREFLRKEHTRPGGEIQDGQSIARLLVKRRRLLDEARQDAAELRKKHSTENKQELLTLEKALKESAAKRAEKLEDLNKQIGITDADGARLDAIERLKLEQSPATFDELPSVEKNRLIGEILRSIADDVQVGDVSPGSYKRDIQMALESGFINDTMAERLAGGLDKAFTSWAMADQLHFRSDMAIIRGMLNLYQNKTSNSVKRGLRAQMLDLETVKSEILSRQAPLRAIQDTIKRTKDGKTVGLVNKATSFLRVTGVLVSKKTDDQVVDFLKQHAPNYAEPLLGSYKNNVTELMADIRRFDDSITDLYEPLLEMAQKNGQIQSNSDINSARYLPLQFAVQLSEADELAFIDEFSRLRAGQQNQVGASLSFDILDALGWIRQTTESVDGSRRGFEIPDDSPFAAMTVKQVQDEIMDKGVEALDALEGIGIRVDGDDMKAARAALDAIDRIEVVADPAVAVAKVGKAGAGVDEALADLQTEFDALKQLASTDPNKVESSRQVMNAEGRLRRKQLENHADVAAALPPQELVPGLERLDISNEEVVRISLDDAEFDALSPGHRSLRLRLEDSLIQGLIKETDKRFVMAAYVAIPGDKLASLNYVPSSVRPLNSGTFVGSGSADLINEAAVTISTLTAQAYSSAPTRLRQVFNALFENGKADGSQLRNAFEQFGIDPDFAFTDVHRFTGALGELVLLNDRLDLAKVNLIRNNMTLFEKVRQYIANLWKEVFGLGDDSATGAVSRFLGQDQFRAVQRNVADLYRKLDDSLVDDASLALFGIEKGLDLGDDAVEKAVRNLETRKTLTSKKFLDSKAEQRLLSSAEKSKSKGKGKKSAQDPDDPAILLSKSRIDEMRSTSDSVAKAEIREDIIESGTARLMERNPRLNEAQARRQVTKALDDRLSTLTKRELSTEAAEASLSSEKISDKDFKFDSLESSEINFERLASRLYEDFVNNDSLTSIDPDKFSFAFGELINGDRGEMLSKHGWILDDSGKPVSYSEIKRTFANAFKRSSRAARNKTGFRAYTDLGGGKGIGQESFDKMAEDAASYADRLDDGILDSVGDVGEEANLRQTLDSSDPAVQVRQSIYDNLRGIDDLVADAANSPDPVVRKKAQAIEAMARYQEAVVASPYNWLREGQRGGFTLSAEEMKSIAEDLGMPNTYVLKANYTPVLGKDGVPQLSKGGLGDLNLFGKLLKDVRSALPEAKATPEQIALRDAERAAAVQARLDADVDAFPAVQEAARASDLGYTDAPFADYKKFNVTELTKLAKDSGEISQFLDQAIDPRVTGQRHKLIDFWLANNPELLDPKRLEEASEVDVRNFDAMLTEERAISISEQAELLRRWDPAKGVEMLPAARVDQINTLAGKARKELMFRADAERLGLGDGIDPVVQTIPRSRKTAALAQLDAETLAGVRKAVEGGQSEVIIAVGPASLKDGKVSMVAQKLDNIRARDLDAARLRANLTSIKKVGLIRGERSPLVDRMTSDPKAFKVKIKERLADGGRKPLPVDEMKLNKNHRLANDTMSLRQIYEATSQAGRKSANAAQIEAILHPVYKTRVRDANFVTLLPNDVIGERYARSSQLGRKVEGPNTASIKVSGGQAQQIARADNFFHRHLDDEDLAFIHPDGTENQQGIRLAKAFTDRMSLMDSIDVNLRSTGISVMQQAELNSAYKFNGRPLGLTMDDLKEAVIDAVGRASRRDPKTGRPIAGNDKAVENAQTQIRTAIENTEKRVRGFSINDEYKRDAVGSTTMRGFQNLVYSGLGAGFGVASLFTEIPRALSAAAFMDTKGIATATASVFRDIALDLERGIDSNTPLGRMKAENGFTRADLRKGTEDMAMGMQFQRFDGRGLRGEVSDDEILKDPAELSLIDNVKDRLSQVGEAASGRGTASAIQNRSGRAGLAERGANVFERGTRALADAAVTSGGLQFFTNAGRSLINSTMRAAFVRNSPKWRELGKMISSGRIRAEIAGIAPDKVEEWVFTPFLEANDAIKAWKSANPDGKGLNAFVREVYSEAGAEFEKRISSDLKDIQRIGRQKFGLTKKQIGFMDNGGLFKFAEPPAPVKDYLLNLSSKDTFDLTVARDLWKSTEARVSYAEAFVDLMEASGLKIGEGGDRGFSLSELRTVANKRRQLRDAGFGKRNKTKRQLEIEKARTDAEGSAVAAMQASLESALFAYTPEASGSLAISGQGPFKDLFTQLMSYQLGSFKTLFMNGITNDGAVKTMAVMFYLGLLEFNNRQLQQILFGKEETKQKALKRYEDILTLEDPFPTIVEALGTAAVSTPMFAGWGEAINTVVGTGVRQFAGAEPEKFGYTPLSPVAGQLLNRWITSGRRFIGNAAGAVAGNVEADKALKSTAKFLADTMMFTGIDRNPFSRAISSYQGGQGGLVTDLVYGALGVGVGQQRMAPGASAPVQQYNQDVGYFSSDYFPPDRRTVSGLEGPSSLRGPSRFQAEVDTARQVIAQAEEAKKKQGPAGQEVQQARPAPSRSSGTPSSPGEGLADLFKKGDV